MILTRSNSYILTVDVRPSIISNYSNVLKVKSRRKLYLAAFSGNMLTFIAGICFGWSAPYVMKLMDQKYLNENPIGRLITMEEASWLGSLIALGAMPATFVAGYFASKIGRKSTMIYVIILPAICTFLCYGCGNHIYFLYLARAISGTIVGGVYTIVPMYLSEIAEDEVRGFLCSSFSVFETFGELTIYCMGPYVTIFAISMFGLVVCTISGFLVKIFVAESPYYLLCVGNIQRAENNLMMLRTKSKDEVNIELQFMQFIAAESSRYKTNFSDLCKTKASKRAKRIISGLIIFQNLSGIMPILLYSQSIFSEADKSLPVQYCSMIIGAVQFLSSFVAPTCVDTFGRKCMLLTSALGMIASQMSLGYYFFMKEYYSDVQVMVYWPVICIVLFIVSYACGFGPLVWPLVGELFPPHLKIKAFSVGVSFWWGNAFVVNKLFYTLYSLINMSGCFWLFGISCCCAFLFVAMFVIETKGKTMEEIQIILNA